MNVNICITKDYENKSNWIFGENKAKTNPNKAKLFRPPKNYSEKTRFLFGFYT